jgi:Mn2+/Fe2+ NRAMP family transporter
MISSLRFKAALLCAALFICPIALASVAYDASGEGIVNNATTGSWTNTPVGTPTGIIVGVYGLAAPTSVKYGGVTMTLDGQSSANASGDVMYIYELPNPATGAQTVLVTLGSASYANGVSISVTGGSTTQVMRTGSFTSQVTNGANPSLTVTSATGDLVVDFVGSRPYDNAYTPTNTLANSSANGNIYCAGQYAAGSSSVTIGWTESGALIGSHAALSVQAPAALTPSLVLSNGHLLLSNGHPVN